MSGGDREDEALTRGQALALVAVGAAVISVTALFVKWISLGPSAIGAYRCGFAAAALGVWVVVARGRSPATVRASGGASRRAWLYAVAAGACYAGDLYVWHRSILLSGTGLATLLANTQVFWVALLSALLLGERLTWRLAVCAALALLGVVLLAIPGLAASPLHLHGIGLGLATGVFYAGYYLCLRASQREPRRLSLAANLWVTCAVAAALWRTLVKGYFFFSSSPCAQVQAYSLFLQVGQSLRFRLNFSVTALAPSFSRICTTVGRSLPSGTALSEISMLPSLVKLSLVGAERSPRVTLRRGPLGAVGHRDADVAIARSTYERNRTPGIRLPTCDRR